jgi:hypothetical protein
MSRSTRKPYAAITGVRSAADDKKVARRCFRRTQNSAIRKFKGEDWDEFLIPVRYEASFNDVWGWGRDGNQTLHDAPVLDWNIYAYNYGCWTEEELIWSHLKRFERLVRYYERLKRK